ncbi:MAG TPA: NAD(P)/FAD-dependent oxidoreductase [Candidatus Dormibacteraeota bacterium]|jgi:kynurenine 3-monooxygenase|nr:NAD(P)/FAD-dependent oxidoreductase [Candidatus Dormibacteraeota bacterium]
MTTVTEKNVAIMGAGLAGTVMAMFLARRGWNVAIYEMRPDPRTAGIYSGRSINMTLAVRGLSALAKVIDVGRILDLTIPLEGRMVHEVDGSTRFHPYGINQKEVIYAVTRSALNARLMDIAQTFPNIHIHFNHRCTAIDKKNWVVEVRNEISRDVLQIAPDFLIGADGTFSSVRQQMHRHEYADFHQEYLESGYRELVFTAGPQGTFQMPHNALHLWPRGKSMLMAIPNLDGTFASNCILPLQGEESFATLGAPGQVMDFFRSQFPDAVNLIDGLPDSFLQKSAGGFITTRAVPWYYRDRIVLIGDACHTVVPFYGLGMNAAFEDCAALDACIEKHRENFELAFQEYQYLRKPHTDVLADLSVQNFRELRDKVRSYTLTARKKVFSTLHRFFPKTVIPIYTLMSHSTMPFADVLNRTCRQDRIARYCGVDLPVALVAGFLAGKDFGRKSLRRPAGQKQTPVPDPKFIAFQEVKVIATSEHLPKNAAEQKQAS